jgi:hypothetical protein
VPADRELVHRNVAEVRSRVAAAATRSGRRSEDVSLIAVTKTVAVEEARWAVDAGIRSLGENYIQELRQKRHEIADVTWHFIGTLQSGTAHGRTLDALIEVDLSEGRTGVRPSELPAFADLVASLDGLHLIGLMTMPPIPKDPEDSRPFFSELRQLCDQVRERHPDVLESSMGMSLDYEVAVEEGATMVRIGTALFGTRAPRPRSRPTSRPTNGEEPT